MIRLLTLLFAASCLTAVGQVTYNPDGNGNGLIDVSDLQTFLSVYNQPFSPFNLDEERVLYHQFCQNCTDDYLYYQPDDYGGTTFEIYPTNIIIDVSSANTGSDLFMSIEFVSWSSDACGWCSVGWDSTFPNGAKIHVVGFPVEQTLQMHLEISGRDLQLFRNGNNQDVGISEYSGQSEQHGRMSFVHLNGIWFEF